MIEGRRPSGYLVTGDGWGTRIERETRQCCHCQYTWVYEPHEEARARNIRGFCLRCYGFTCQRAECHAEQQNLLREFPQEGTCLSYTRYHQLRLQRIAKHPLWDVTPEGIIVAKDEKLILPVGGITY